MKWEKNSRIIIILGLIGLGISKVIFFLGLFVYSLQEEGFLEGFKKLIAESMANNITYITYLVTLLTEGLTLALIVYCLTRFFKFKE